MKRIFPLLVLLVAAWAAQAQMNRIPAGADKERAEVRGNVHPLTRNAADLGMVPGSLTMPRITIFFNRTPAQQADLENLLQAQQEPSSPDFHRWLTPAQFGDRFGLSPADYAQVAGWLKAQGFQVIETPASRSYIAVSGSAAQVASVLGAPIHQYELHGKMHVANATDPALPASIANAVLGIRGLHDFRPRARAIRQGPRPMFTSSISGNHFLTPDDFATIYHLKPLYDNGIDGTGQWVGVMGQTDIPLADVATFRSRSGLPANAPVVKPIPNAVAGVSASDIGEADLDVEWSGAVARKATIVYVNAGTAANMSVFDSLTYAVNNQITVGNTTHLVPVLSISYGDCESHWSQSDINSLSALFQQANAQGQTIVGPSGDSDAADCEPLTATTATHGLAVDFPSSSAFVTAVGGTMFNGGGNVNSTTDTCPNLPNSQCWSSANNSFNGSVLGYVPELVWNETATNQGQIVGGGGGKSTMQVNGSPNAKPVWQTALTPADGLRDVPDLSLGAGFIHDGYLICASNQSPADCTNGFRDTNTNLDAIGGTSAGVPTFAGIVALLNQVNPPVAPLVGQGNVNPRLYQLAGASADAFHDITAGNNIVPCTSGTPDCPASVPFQFGFSAVAGYDRATGLGSIDAYNFVSEWPSGAPSPPPAPDFTMSSATQSLVVTRGSSTPVMVTVGATNGFNGNVTLSCIIPSSLPGVTCSFPVNPVAAGSATVNINVSASAALMPPASPVGPSLAWLGGGTTLIVGLVLGAAGDGKKRRTALLAGTLTMLLLIGMLAGCGGSSGTVTPTPTPTPPPAQLNGTVVIQGLNQADVHITTVALTVN